MKCFVSLVVVVVGFDLNLAVSREQGPRCLPGGLVVDSLPAQAGDGFDPNFGNWDPTCLGAAESPCQQLLIPVGHNAETCARRPCSQQKGEATYREASTPQLVLLLLLAAARKPMRATANASCSQKYTHII